MDLAILIPWSLPNPVGGHIMYKSMKKAAIVCLIAIGVFFWIDTHIRSEKRDPLRVAKDFTFGLMYQDKGIMKIWSGDEALNEEIDEMKIKEFPFWYTSASEGERTGYSIDRKTDYEDLYLVSFRRLDPMIVCTFEYDQFKDPCNTLFYTIALLKLDSENPIAAMSLWERLHDSIAGLVNDFFKKIKIRSYGIKPRWGVVDYYTEDDFFSMRSQELDNLKEKVEEEIKYRKMTPKEKNEYDKMKQVEGEKNLVEIDSIDWDSLGDKVSKFKGDWLEAELMKQNQEARLAVTKLNRLE